MLIIAVKRFKPAAQALVLSFYLTVFKKEITKIKKIRCNVSLKDNNISFFPSFYFMCDLYDSIGHIYIELNYIILAYHYRSD